MVMKKLLFLILSGFVFFIFPSCHKPVDDDQQNKSIKQIVVNDDFDWQTSAAIDFSIKKSSSGVIIITSENEDILYHKGFFNALSSTYDISLNIPDYVEKVLVNGHLVEITGSKISVDLDAPVYKQESFRFDDPPVAYWRFNENSGTAVNDEEGTSNGTFSGAEWTTGINKYALKFDGSGGKVEIPSNNALNITGNKISLSVWFKKDSDNDDGAFMFCRTKYILRIDNHGKITFAVYTPGWHATTIPWSKRIVDTDWHHVVATYNGKYIKLYVDGKLLSKKEASGKLKSTNSPVNIGSEGSINYFNGTIDEAAVYSKALSKDEILSIYSSTPAMENGEDALISQWKFDENSGNTATDSKNNNNGTINNAQWTTGVNGGALKFNGSNSFVLIPNADNLNPVNQITLMAWAKTEENKTAKIAEKGDWDGHNILQDKWNGWTAKIRTADNKSRTINWQNGIPVYGEWYHIAMTYDGVNFKLYVNGQLTNSKKIVGRLHVNNRNFVIGSNGGTQKFFNGAIDDVRIFDKALTQTEIQAIFSNQGNTGNNDSDGDGVEDDQDDYPDDPARAFNNYYPASNFGSLSFEDLWPGQGDYDFNDLVLDYRFTTVTNVSNKVVDVIGTIVIRAIGAGQSNGFGFQLPNNNVDQADITVSGTVLKSDYIQLADNGLEEGQAKPTIIVFDDANEIMPAEEGFGVNVEPDKIYVDPDTIVISMAFAVNKYTATDIDLIHFNPFMIVSKIRGKEIHLPDYSPTSLVDPAYFGSMDDDSDPALDRYYKTVNNLPWAINITESFDYLIEKNEITTGYLKFYDWAASSGTLYPDWYKDNAGYRNNAVIYQIPE